MGVSPQSKRFCFTINNPEESDCNAVLDLSAVAVYLIAGDEVGENGTPHIQGYVVFKHNWRLSKVSKALPRAHIQVARGTSLENRTYCSKGGKFEEFGECPVDTRISTKSNQDVWSEALALARADRISEIRPDLQIRYFRSFELIRDRALPKPAVNSKLVNLWIHGGTGTGKTKWCWEQFPDHYPKLKNKWWDGYNQEKVVCMQEFGKKHEMLSEYLKEWADHYPFRCERKGSSLVINCKMIIITSNYTPNAIWTEEEILEPLYRRFKVIQFPDEIPTAEDVLIWKEYLE